MRAWLGVVVSLCYCTKQHNLRSWTEMLKNKVALLRYTYRSYLMTLTVMSRILVYLVMVSYISMHSGDCRPQYKWWKWNYVQIVRCIHCLSAKMGSFAQTVATKSGWWSSQTTDFRRCVPALKMLCHGWIALARHIVVGRLFFVKKRFNPAATTWEFNDEKHALFVHEICYCRQKHGDRWISQHIGLTD